MFADELERIEKQYQLRGCKRGAMPARSDDYSDSYRPEFSMNAPKRRTRLWTARLETSSIRATSNSRKENQ